MISSVFRTATRSTFSRAAVSAHPRLILNNTSLYIKSTPLFVRFNSVNAITKDSPVTKYSSSAPIVKYTQEHEWLAVHEDNIAFLGITKHAADALGDVTYVELPTPEEVVGQGDSIGSVESVKSASDIYSPVDGEIIEGNLELTDDATLVNQDPMGQAWFAKIKVTSPEQLDDLLSLEDYEEFLKNN